MADIIVDEDSSRQIKIRRRVRTAPSTSPASPPDGYEVGYGRPPKSTQFKPGISGNPKGRPKGAQNLSTIVKKVMNEPVTMRTPTGTRRVRKIDAIVHQAVAKATQGDMRAITCCAALYRSAVSEQPDEPPAPAALEFSNDDDSLIAKELRRIFGSASPQAEEHDQ